MEAVELLSPAKDLETGIAAVNCGADAVYIGASRFGAREAAGNPLEEIEQLARYAHRYWARVYVTINTLLKDDEIEQAAALARRLYECGADAIIIQDAGLLECSLPPIAVFASTQMHNHTPERVAFLEKVGIRRAILARELSLEQIRAIRAQAPAIELESFVHGALCVSYSGQCYLSYAIGGRSGNRGQCAQPCRRLYRLEDGKGSIVQGFRHLLSLRDLNLSEHLQALLDAGVRSFKIEGRLKDKTYVMNVVGHYRQKLDEILLSNTNSANQLYKASSSGQSALDFTPEPLKTFNRGFSTYFLTGRGAPLASWDTPKSMGEPVGRVAALRHNSFTLDSSTSIQRGDGLCFFDSKRELRGTTVNDVQGSAIFPAKMDGLAAGVEVYRNHDHAFLSSLEKSSLNRPFEARKIQVRMRLSGSLSELSLWICDEDGIQAKVSLQGQFTLARNGERARTGLEKQLRKLGGTEYECAGVEIALAEPPFVSAADANALRRGAVDALTAARAENRPRLDGSPVIPNETPFPDQDLSFEGNILNQKAADFYRRHGVAHFEAAAESGLLMRGRRVMTTRYCIKYELGACPRYQAARSPVQRLVEPLALVDEQGQRFPLRFNCAKCEMEVYFQEQPNEPTRTDQFAA